MWSSGRGLLLTAVFLRIARALVPLGMLWVSKYILDALIAHVSGRSGSLVSIWPLVAVEIGLAVANGLLAHASTFGEGRLGQRFAERMSLRLVEHALRLDLASFESPDFHEKLERARRQATGRNGLMASLLETGQQAIAIVAISITVALQDPWLLLLLGATMIPAAVAEAGLMLWIHPNAQSRAPARRQLEYLRYLGTSAQTSKETRAYSLGPYLVRRYRQLSEALLRDDARRARTRAVTASALGLVSTAGYFAAYAIVLARALGGGLSIGTFAFLARCLMRSRQVIDGILGALSDAVEQALFLDDLFDFLALQPTIRSRAGAPAVPRPLRKGLVFEKVSFGYPRAERPIVQNLSFTIGATERVALVGENGAGKTTIVKLLARLYEPTAGRILLDGVDLRDYDIESLRRSMSVVFQDYVRYDLSVRENIGFGDIDAVEDQARIEAAAHKSLAARLTDRLPDGYAQVLGRRFRSGVELSGGEWQRLALARAYMRDAQFLVLDEPTSALDPEAEHELFQRFAQIVRGRMALLISHRFSTVRMADRILVVAEGAIHEHGTHEELLRSGGPYARLFDLQAAAYR